MQKWEESIKTTLNNTKHSSAYLLHLLSMKEIHISISKLQISKKIPNFKRICSLLCREKCCCSHRDIWRFIEHLRPQKWQFQLLSEESTTHNTTPCCKQEHQPSSLRRGLLSFIWDPIWCLWHREIAFSEHGCPPTQHLEKNRRPPPPVSAAEKGGRRSGTQPELCWSSPALGHHTTPTFSSSCFL